MRYPQGYFRAARPSRRGLIVGGADVAGEYGVDVVELGQGGRQLADGLLDVDVEGHLHHGQPGGWQVPGGLAVPGRLSGDVVDGESLGGGLLEDLAQDAGSDHGQDGQACAGR